MKKHFVVGLVVLLITIFLVGLFLFKLNIAVWMDEGDAGFKDANDIRTVLKRALPERDFTEIRYYKLHKNPKFINSIYAEYVDEDFSMYNLSKYLDEEKDSGEFFLLADALCGDEKLRLKYRYKLVQFHVISSEIGVRYYFDDYDECE